MILARCEPGQRGIRAATSRNRSKHKEDEMTDSHRWPTVRYEDLEPRLRTGDVLLFHGASRRSRIIETASGSEFSHVAMIVRANEGEPPLLWHTDPRAVTDDVVGDRE